MAIGKGKASASLNVLRFHRLEIAQRELDESVRSNVALQISHFEHMTYLSFKLL